MFPIKLAIIFTKMAKKYGPTIMHSGNPDKLTEDLGDALRRQKKVITDPDLGALETASEALPVIAEVKLLTLFVSKKLEIDTSGKSTIAILEEIVQKTEANKSKSADEIKNTLDWTRTFFANPEIQDLLKADMTGIEMPASPKGVVDVFRQVASRLPQEVVRLQAFMEHAKKPLSEPPAKPKRQRKKPDPSV